MTSLSEKVFYFFYRFFGWPVLRGLFEIAKYLLPKVREGLEMRRPTDGRSPWVKTLPPSPPTVWFHCASGEFEYAKPVIRELKKRSANLKIVVTYFSPSYADAIRKFPEVDWVVPLPWDRPRDLNAFLDSYRPMALLVARTDVWPEMAHQARLRGMKSILFSAALTSQSRRMRGLGRWPARATLNQLDAIFCVSDDDAAAFKSLKLTRPVIQRQGDTRFDQVFARLAKPKPLRAEIFDSHEWLVCGSTWPEDEARLIPAAAALLAMGMKTCFVPHEPSAEHIASLETRLQSGGLLPVRYSDPEAASKIRANNACLVFDGTGFLAELYTKSRYAFVGGSFKKNVHSVMEPLAAGCLTFVGPHFQNNREAIAFKELGFVRVVTTDASLVSEIQNARPVSGADVREKIVAAVRSRTGATDLLIEWLTPILRR